MGKLVRCFEDLVAWQRANDLAVCVYEMSAEGRFARDFAFTNQIRKSAVSISSNIAEGFERNSRRDFRRFLAIAKASCGELRSQLHLAMRLGYITQSVHDPAVVLAQQVTTKIANLRESIKPA